MVEKERIQKKSLTEGQIQLLNFKPPKVDEKNYSENSTMMLDSSSKQLKILDMLKK
jgi:hypothetical protein